MTPLDQIRVDTSDTRCAVGHQVTLSDIKPLLVDGSVLHVCVFCWQQLDMQLLTATNPGQEVLRARRLHHRRSREKLLLDQVAMDRVSCGRAPYTLLTMRERTEVVLALHKAGLSTDAIGKRIQMNPRTVTRYRAGDHEIHMAYWETRLLATVLRAGKLVAA